MQPDSVLVALRLPEEDGYAGEMPAPRVKPGARTMMVALIRNQSGIVDNYDMAVDGLPEGWWTINPGTVYLVPYGAGGGSYEQEITVELHPPRVAEAEARRWDVRIIARSRAYGAEAGGAAATLNIEPFEDFDAEITPERRGGRTRADFKLAVTNKSNSDFEVTFAGVDPENACHFSFHEMPQRKGVPKVDLDGAAGAMRQARYLGVGHGNVDPAYAARRMVDQFAQGNLGPLQRLFRGRNLPPEIGGVHLDPGEREEAIVSVSPPKQIWIGRPVLHPFQVMTRPAGSETPGPPVAGTYRQKPWLPWWLIIVIPLLVLLAIWLLSMRTEMVKVPNLVGAQDRAAAAALLEEAGLEVGAEETVEAADKPPKSILSQEPAAGKEVEKGSKVAIRIAVASTTTQVPDLTGKTIAEASALLQQAGLQLGAQQPPATDPNTDRIASQLDPPGSQVNVGKAINVFLATPETTETGATSTPTTPGTGPPPPPGAPPGAPPAPPAPPASGDLTVPSVTGITLAKAGEALQGKKLVPASTAVFSADVPAGQVVSQDPPPGAPIGEGQQVKIVVSKGFPDIILDLNGNIVSVGGAQGQPIRKLAAAPEIEEEPAVSPNGRLVVYKKRAQGSDPASGQLWTLDPADPNSAKPLTTAGLNDGRPAISPDGRVVAFISNRGGNPAEEDLCFVRLDQGGAQPACVSDSSTRVSRPAWSPDGKSIVVVGSDQAQAERGQTELLLYTTQVPNSSTPTDWVRQGFITDTMHGQKEGEQVISAAFSPDGTRLAFSANWKDGVAKVFIAKVEGGVILPENPAPQGKIPACEVAWRSDSGELAVAVRDAGCDQKGRIVRVDLANPSEQVVLTRVGSSSGNPVWSPVAGG
jgi:beta-lactam-binding protein with PASTA domain